MTSPFRIGDRLVGAGHATYLVAEMSANHGGDLDTALGIVRAAKDAGADAMKLQTYTPDTMTIQSDKACFRIGGGTLWDGRTLHDLYSEAFMPWGWQSELKAAAEDLGLGFFSTAFDRSSVDFLEGLGVPIHKVASFESVDIPLIRYMASTGKPLMISTGMAKLDEIEEAVDAALEAGAPQVMLLKCTSAYPASPDEMNLRAIADLERRFHVPVGLSDHTTNTVVAVVGVALGACLVEKHLTLSRLPGGPDSGFSLEPHEFRSMVDAVRTAETALGFAQYGPGEHEKSSLAFRRSLFVVEDVKQGERFSEQNVRSIRPSGGLRPKYLTEVIGRRAAADIERGTPLSLEMLAGDGSDDARR